MPDDNDDNTDPADDEWVGARTPAVGSRPGSTSDPFPEPWGIPDLPPGVDAPDENIELRCLECGYTLEATPKPYESTVDSLDLWCPECTTFTTFSIDE